MIASSSLALTLVLQATPSIAAPETQVPASLHWFDLDGNGELDALAVEPAGGIRLLRHEGGGLFTEETSAWGLEGLEGVTGVLVGDPDGDGATDLVLSTTRGLRVHLQSIGAFVDVTPGAGLEGVGPVASVGWVDANGDRRADLHVVTTCGHRVFLNEGGGAFAELDFGLVASDASGPGTGAAVGGTAAGAALPGEAGAGVTAGAGPRDAPRGPRAASGSPVHLQAGAAGMLTLSARTVSPGGGVSVAPASGSAPLDLSTCAQTVFDLGSGSCVQASSIPTAGMLYPLGPELMIDAVTGNVGIGMTTPGYALEVAGQILSGTGNSAAGPESAVGGGRSNAASGEVSTIAGGDSNTTTGLGAFVGGGASNAALSDRASVAGGVGNRAAYRAFVGGGDNNEATGNVTAIAGGKLNEALQTGAFIGGGENNVVDATHATIAGGLTNSATGSLGTVAGGGSNVASGLAVSVGGGEANQAVGDRSTIAGGQGNVIQGLTEHAFIGGGQDNRISGSEPPMLDIVRHSTIGGGLRNTIRTFDSVAQWNRFGMTISGGVDNLIDGSSYSTIGGGKDNTVTGNSIGAISFSVIAGGVGNETTSIRAAIGGGGANSVTGNDGTISGGIRNEGSELCAIGGGADNLVTGTWGVIPGGQLNEVAGRWSFAAGRRAKAMHDGSFVFNGAATDLSTTADNQFLVSAPGGVGVGTNAPRGALEVAGSVRASGAGASLLAYNPNDDGAQVKLDWNNDVARIRIGGSGVGAQNGLDIQSVGDQSLMRIQDNGRVGIGTSSPASKLHVAGGSGVGLLASGDTYSGFFVGPVLIDGGTDVGATSGGYVAIGDAAHNIAIDDNEIMARNATGAADLTLNAEGGNVEMMPSGPGRVGIGTSSPDAKLEVIGDPTFDVFRVRVGGTTRLVLDGNGTLGVGANFTPSYDLQISSSAPNGGTAAKPGGGSWSNSSDRRLKKNIEDLDGALEMLLALRGVTYEYKDPAAIHELPGARIGFIAQEVEEVIPDWVSEKPDGMKMLTVRGFEALAVEALRELREEHRDEVTELRVEGRRQAEVHARRVAELEVENEELRSRLEELESVATRLQRLEAALQDR